AAAPRPAIQILAEALKRALDSATLLEGLGGLGATPVALESDLDARTVGFSERERRLLANVDGESTVEDLLLGSGLKQESALKTLLVARLIGLLDTRPPSTPRALPAIEIDVARLDAKYDEVQEADYFSILGLPRSAGGDEVQRAFQHLASEFHPLKFAGHPDP